MEFIDKIISAIHDAEAQGRLQKLEGVTGFSGDKLIGLLQRCTKISESIDKSCYLEIGVFQGLTLSSVAAVASNVRCFGIDDFSQFDADGRNRTIVEERLNKHTRGNAVLINDDFEAALLNLRSRINDLCLTTYFIDGPHDYRSQYLCLDYAKPYLGDQAVILIDDSNYEHVRRANSDWLKANPDFALLYESYTQCHPGNMTEHVEKTARAGWWNGINVIVRDTKHRINRIYPPVDPSRERYFNDHNVHPAKYAELAPQLLNILSDPLPVSIVRFLKLLFTHVEFKERFRNMNTYSDKIQTNRMASLSQK